MVVHKCDVCGKEVGVWLHVFATPDATRAETDVSRLMRLAKESEICEDCAKSIANTAFIESEKKNAPTYCST